MKKTLGLWILCLSFSGFLISCADKNRSGYYGNYYYDDYYDDYRYNDYSYERSSCHRYGDCDVYSRSGYYGDPYYYGGYYGGHYYYDDDNADVLAVMLGLGLLGHYITK